ncbi:MAG: SEC-C domain-containing protein [Alphaproteobacteria bacterium]|nr:SEC-C domain-containing protein [Alphaproteobacteria bacterium]
MPPISPTRRCPCHSGKRYKRCCQPHHEGRPAPSPEALMRSRYSAYALGLTDYLIATTAPESPHRVAPEQRWVSELSAFSQATRFVSLEIREAWEEGERGLVHFVAGLSQAGHRIPMEERSLFRRADGRWLYVEAEP